MMENQTFETNLKRVLDGQHVIFLCRNHPMVREGIQGLIKNLTDYGISREDLIVQRSTSSVKFDKLFYEHRYAEPGIFRFMTVDSAHQGKLQGYYAYAQFLEGAEMIATQRLIDHIDYMNVRAATRANNPLTSRPS